MASCPTTLHRPWPPPLTDLDYTTDNVIIVEIQVALHDTVDIYKIMKLKLLKVMFLIVSVDLYIGHMHIRMHVVQQKLQVRLLVQILHNG